MSKICSALGQYPDCMENILINYPYKYYISILQRRAASSYGRDFRAVPNFFHLEGGGRGQCHALAEVENMAALQPFTLGRSGGMLPQEILGVLSRILVHSEAYSEAQRAS